MGWFFFPFQWPQKNTQEKLVNCFAQYSTLVLIDCVKPRIMHVVQQQQQLDGDTFD
jgi:hypothetical protein